MKGERGIPRSSKVKSGDEGENPLIVIVCSLDRNQSC